MIDGFCMLNLPRQLLTGVWGGKWVVCTTYVVDGKPYGYLHSDNKIYGTWFIDGHHTTVIFETRFNALIEMRAYYRRYKGKFPYDDELSEELNAKFARVKKSQVIKSQVMVFK